MDIDPPPKLLANIAILYKFFICIKIYVFKQERPEMDDFEEEKNFVVKGR